MGAVVPLRERLAQNKAAFLVLAALLFVGVYARFVELEWHFSNVDDMGVAEIILKNRATGEWGRFPISRFYTYAPFQYLITPLLISQHLEYRDLLFWGRLPSCVFGSLGLVALVLFYWKLDGVRSGKVFPALAILACAWENIIHAKQMHPYALGVTATLLLFIVFLAYLDAPKPSAGRAAVSGLLAALASHVQYQLMAFVPAFFAALAAREWRRAGKLAAIRHLALGIAVYAAAVFPMWFFLLRPYLAENAGAPPWAWGPANEFMLAFAPGTPIPEQVVRTVDFFVRNFWVVFQADTAVVPEQSPLFLPFSLVLAALLGLGVASFVRTRDERRRWLAIFFALVVITWDGLVLLRKLTFGPTRHSLILLPFFAVTISEGLAYALAKVRASERASLFTSAGLSVTLAVVFLANYGTFLEERRDPFVESEIVKTLREYKVDTILSNQRSDGLPLMKQIQAYQEEIDTLGMERYKTMAWISRSEAPVTKDSCEDMRRLYNARIEAERAATGKFFPTIDHPCSAYRVVYARRQASDLQVDFSRRTQNAIYTNGFYFYIVTREERQ